MTLEERADKYCEDNGIFDGAFSTKKGVKSTREILVEFARETASAKLAEAAEKAELKQEGKEGTYKRYYIPFKENPIVVDKESITSIPLD